MKTNPAPGTRHLVPLLLLFALFSCTKEKIGLQWEEQESNTLYDLQSVCFVDELHGQAVGGDSWYFGVDLFTSDGGNTWTADSLTDKLLYQVHFDEEERGYLCGTNGYFFSKEKPADAWDFTRLGRWDAMKAMAVSTSGQVLLGGGSAYRTGHLVRLDEDYNVDSTIILDNEISSIDFVDSETAVAVGYGIILRTENAGLSWEVLPVNGDFYRCVHFPTGNVGYIVGFAGSILKSTDAGKTWTTLRKGSSILVGDKPFRSVYFVDEDRGYIVGDKGLCWKTTNGGADWQVIDNLPKINFRDIFVVDSEGWIVGQEGRIIHFQE